MVRPTAIVQKLKVAQRATRTVPQLGFARPTKPQNPLHLYRQALRLAHQIAERWEDPYIFYYHRLKAARQLRSPGTISRGHVARTKWTKEKVERTMSPAEVNRFKRLKACVSTLKRAEMGHVEPMYKVLRETYARTGVLRATAMEHLLPNLDPSNNTPQPTWAVLKLIQSPIASSSSPDATTMRNLRRYTRLNPAIAAGEEPPRLLLEERKLRNRMQFKVFGKVMDGLRPPLIHDVVKKVEENARRAVMVSHEEGEASATREGVGASTSPHSAQVEGEGETQSQWAEQDFSQGGPILKDALQALGTRPRRGPPKPLELGPLHPSSKWYGRGRRRAWGMLLSELPILSLDPPPTTLAELVDTQHSASTSSAQEAGATSLSSPLGARPLPPHLKVQPSPLIWKPLWGSQPRLPIDGLRPLLEAYNAQEHSRHLWSGEAHLDSLADEALEAERARMREQYEGLSWTEKRGRRWRERAEQWVKDSRLNEGAGAGKFSEQTPATPSAPRLRLGPQGSSQAQTQRDQQQSADNKSAPRKKKGPPPEEKVHLYISPLALRSERPKGGSHSGKPRRARFGSETFVSEEEAEWARRTEEE